VKTVLFWGALLAACVGLYFAEDAVVGAISEGTIHSEYFSAMATVIPILMLTVFTSFGRLRNEILSAGASLLGTRSKIDAKFDELARIERDAKAEQDDELLRQVAELRAQLTEQRDWLSGLPRRLWRSRIWLTITVLMVTLFGAGGELVALWALGTANFTEAAARFTLIPAAALLAEIVLVEVWAIYAERPT
jgi:hypothetical protein